jgi:hypothetical protein
MGEQMTAFSFRPAVRSNVPLLIGLAGGTGAGKTYSALRLARGIAGGHPIVGIDTENGRMNHYADLFSELHVGQITAPFRPDKYADAIDAAEKYLAALNVPIGHRVVVVDSASHEWYGEGGCLEWHDDLMGGQHSKNLSAWIEPKKSHKRMVNRLLQVESHVILCFRAEPKVEAKKGENGRLEIVPKESLVGIDGWIPIAEKNLPFELTASFLLMADRPGVPRPIKLQEQHRPYFPLDKPITEESGAALAEWARGGQIDWIARIEAAQTKTDLAAIGRQIALVKASLPESAQILITSAYKDRLEQFAPQLRERVQFSNDEKRIS